MSAPDRIWLNPDVDSLEGVQVYDHRPKATEGEGIGYIEYARADPMRVGELRSSTHDREDEPIRTPKGYRSPWS